MKPESTFAHRSHALVAGQGLNKLTICLGLLIAINFALAKFSVQNGISFLAAFYWQLFGASLILITLMLAQGQRLSVRRSHVRYYLIGGLLGVSLPQLLAYAALEHIPNGLFTVLVTLSPIATFALTSLYERRLLPFYRFAGIMIGLAGITLATLHNLDLSSNLGQWTIIALAVPLLLAITNIYRNKALPSGVASLPLATGTLLSQAILLTPLIIISDERYLPFSQTSNADFAVLALAGVTALSYILTFMMQRFTDGIGFSQIGYFITLGGILIGAVFFGEAIGLSLILSAALLFLGLAITNGHFKRRP